MKTEVSAIRAELQRLEEKQQAEADRARAAGEAAAAEARAAGEASALRALADAEATARRLRAEAEADAIRAEGQARAESIETEAEAIASNQEAILSQRVLDVLPSIMAEFAKGYSAIGNVSIVGGGSGEEGASRVIGADSATAMKSVFDSVQAATGIDLATIIQGQAVGRAFGSGMADAAASEPVQVATSRRTTKPKAE